MVAQALLAGMGIWRRSTVRAMHPWGGVVFALALALMFRRWASRWGSILTIEPAASCPKIRNA